MKKFEKTISNLERKEKPSFAMVKLTRSRLLVLLLVCSTIFAVFRSKIARALHRPDNVEFADGSNIIYDKGNFRIAIKPSDDQVTMFCLSDGTSSTFDIDDEDRIKGWIGGKLSDLDGVVHMAIDDFENEELANTTLVEIDPNQPDQASNTTGGEGNDGEEGQSDEELVFDPKSKPSFDYEPTPESTPT